MENLSQETRSMGLETDQVQDFTPTPLTVATTIFATGYHPYTLEKVFCEHDPEEKRRQKSFFFEKVNGRANVTKQHYTNTKRNKDTKHKETTNKTPLRHR